MGKIRLKKQFDESDCGAACLAMVSSAFGSKWSIARIREAAGTDRHGTNLNGLILAAETLGFQAKAMKSPEKELAPDLPLPFIAHQSKESGLLHFVVVYRITKSHVWIADPADRKRKISIGEFKRDWTGYAVFLTPSPYFKPSIETKGRLAKYLPLLKPHVGTILKSILASVILNILGIIGSFYFGYVIDAVLPAKASLSLTILSIGMIFLTLFQVLLGVIRNHILLHFSLKTSLTLNFSYLKKVLSLPMNFFDSRKVGEILSRLEDGAKVRGILSGAALSVIIDVLMMVVAAVFLVLKNWTLFLVAVAAVPLSTIVLWSFARFFRENYRTQMSQGADSQSFLVETMNGMATIKGLNAADQAFDEVEKRLMKVNRTAYRGAVMANIQGLLVGLIDGWGGNVLLWVGSYFILKDSLSLGGLIAFNTILGYFLGPLKRLLGLQTSIQEALVAADRLGEVMELDSEIDSEEKKLQPERFGGAYEFSGVTFRYGSKRPVLTDLSFSIKAGTKVAFIGPSGCGKSTLVKLMLKFYSPEAGKILLDGNDLIDLDTAHLRAHIGYVPQEVFLFSGSIRDNLCLHKPEATFEEVVEAARRAEAHEFITELPERYDTVLAERGSSLSGGERQRLALARALIGGPDILIFDEATSNLDVITEKSIHETIRELANEGLTTILVAHRLSTVVSCDEIFVMEKGKIVESGNHYELVKRDGPYARLWEYQRV